MCEFRHHDFQIGLPAQWVDSSTVILVGPADGNFSPNITITRERLASPSTAQEYAASQLRELSGALEGQGYRVLQEAPMTAGKTPAYQRLHTFSIPDANVQVRQWQVYITQQEDAITITCTDKVDTFEESFKVFREAVSLFRFEAT